MTYLRSVDRTKSQLVVAGLVTSILNLLSSSLEAEIVEVAEESDTISAR